MKQDRDTVTFPCTETVTLPTGVNATIIIEHCFHDVAGTEEHRPERVCCNCGVKEEYREVFEDIPCNHGSHFPRKMIKKWVRVGSSRAAQLR